MESMIFKSKFDRLLSILKCQRRCLETDIQHDDNLLSFMENGLKILVGSNGSARLQRSGSPSEDLKGVNSLRSSSDTVRGRLQSSSYQALTGNDNLVNIHQYSRDRIPSGKRSPGIVSGRSNEKERARLGRQISDRASNALQKLYELHERRTSRVSKPEIRLNSSRVGEILWNRKRTLTSIEEIGKNQKVLLKTRLNNDVQSSPQTAKSAKNGIKVGELFKKKGNRESFTGKGTAEMNRISLKDDSTLIGKRSKHKQTDIRAPTTTNIYLKKCSINVATKSNTRSIFDSDDTSFRKLHSDVVELTPREARHSVLDSRSVVKQSSMINTKLAYLLSRYKQ